MNEISARELQAFGETLNASANDKLRIAEAAMEAQVRRMHGLLLRAWLRPLVIGLLVGLGLLLGICGGSWGLMQWQSSRVQNLLETQEALQVEIAEAQTALEQLQAQTWGVRLYEAEDGTRHVLFPKGALGEHWRWNVHGQPAIQLSSE